jgi:hypothetical protein
MASFNKSKIFTLSFKLSTLHVVLAWEDYHNFSFGLLVPFALGESDIQKLRAGKHSVDYTMIEIQLMIMWESFSISTEP